MEDTSGATEKRRYEEAGEGRSAEWTDNVEKIFIRGVFSAVKGVLERYTYIHMFNILLTPFYLLVLGLIVRCVWYLLLCSGTGTELLILLNKQ